MSIRKYEFAAALAAGLAAGLCGAPAFADAVDVPTQVPQADTRGDSAADAAIVMGVKSRLMGDESLRDSEVEVSSNDGVVTLQGQVRSADGALEAEAAARSVDGVRAVRNELSGPQVPGYYVQHFRSAVRGGG